MLDSLLGSQWLFDDFSSRELAQIAGVMTERVVYNGEVLMLANERPDRLFVVLEGTIEVSRVEDGTDRVLALLGPGSMVGLVALLDRGRRAATCTARGKGRVAEMPRDSFDMLQQSNAPLADKFQYAVARQLAQDVKQMTRGLLADALGE